ncbi:MAG: alpha/beta hydrolase [Pseudomonadales bacterium]|nr:alpha/beta hydrolase [Pseudomonadales bacterium]
MVEFPQPTLIDVNGITLEVFEAGRPGRPIVLCHGFPELAYSWRHQVAPLVAAGYHVIAPNQRGYGHSSRPGPVEDYDLQHLCGDLVALLDHYGYADAIFVGHDWGAIVVWGLAMLHPTRVSALANLSVPFLERGPVEWVQVWEQALGGDFYIVHFNRQPGVADAVFDANVERLLGNLYRTRQWLAPPRAPKPGMALVNLALSDEPSGDPLMSPAELAVFVTAFRHSGFTGPINWYRNFTRNWSLLANVPQRVEQPVLMIHGQYDMVPANPRLTQFAPLAEVHTLPCGHWIQQEEPAQTNRLLLEWLGRRAN